MAQQSLMENASRERREDQNTAITSIERRIRTQNQREMHPLARDCAHERETYPGHAERSITVCTVIPYDSPTKLIPSLEIFPNHSQYGV